MKCFISFTTYARYKTFLDEGQKGVQPLQSYVYRSHFVVPLVNLKNTNWCMRKGVCDNVGCVATSYELYSPTFVPRWC